jgi:predicted kinase
VRELTSRLLRARWSVIVDGTFLHRSQRDHFHALARECGVSFGILTSQATPEQCRARIVERSALGRDVSEATLEVLDQQLKVCEPLAEDESLWPEPAPK